MVLDQIPERYGIQGRPRIQIIIEIGVDRPPLLHLQPAMFGPGQQFRFGVIVIRAAFQPVKPHINEIRRHPIPHRPVWRVGHANRDCVFRQTIGYLIIKPRFVAKLDSMPRGFPMPQRL